MDLATDPSDPFAPRYVIEGEDSLGDAYWVGGPTQLLSELLKQQPEALYSDDAQTLRLGVILGYGMNEKFMPIYTPSQDGTTWEEIPPF